MSSCHQFFISEFGNSLYVNSTFGWPLIFASDLPGAEDQTPDYSGRAPQSQSGHIALLTGLYNGDPAGAGFTGTEQIKDPAGLNFRIQDPPLLMAEAQYLYNQDKTAQGLARHSSVCRRVLSALLRASNLT